MRSFRSGRDWLLQCSVQMSGPIFPLFKRGCREVREEFVEKEMEKLKKSPVNGILNPFRLWVCLSPSGFCKGANQILPRRVE